MFDVDRAPLPHIPGFEVLRLLGTGGMGAVYLAKQVEMDRLVALKIPPPELAADPAYRRRFVREAQLSVKVRHAHLVQGILVGQFGDVPYFVMEYVEGRSLDKVLEVEGPMPEGRAGALAVDLCAALTALHAKGIIHRDIKPANIRLTDEGVIKLVDFGIAVAAAGDRITRHESGVGTPGYMPPEQWRGSLAIEPRMDVFALGVTLYRIVTGAPLFRSEATDPAERDADVYRQMTEESYRPLFAPGGPISRDLAAVIERAVRSEPTRRYDSATEMAEALAAVPAVRAWRGDRPKPRDRRRMAYVAAALSALAAGGVLVATLSRTTRPADDGPLVDAAERLAARDTTVALATLDAVAADAAAGPAAAAFAAEIRGGTAVLLQTQTAARTDRPRPISAARDVRLADGDQFRLGVYMTATCSLYVLHVDSLRKVTTLFPNPAFSSHGNPIEAGKVVWIPAAMPEERWLRLDGTRGPETIYVVATADELAHPDALAALIGERPQIPVAALEGEVVRSLARPLSTEPNGCFAHGAVQSFAFQHE